MKLFSSVVMFHIEQKTDRFCFSLNIILLHFIQYLFNVILSFFIQFQLLFFHEPKQNFDQKLQHLNDINMVVCEIRNKSIG